MKGRQKCKLSGVLNNRMNKIMDEDGTTENILVSWDVPSEVVENFKKNDISKEHFKYLVSNDIYLKELCPHIGHRIELKSKLQNYLDSVTDTETASSLNEDLITIKANCPELMQDDQDQSIVLTDITFDLDSYLNIPSRLSLPEFDLKTILQSSPQGNSVINYYKKYKQLNSQKRNIVVDVLVKYHYTFIVNNNIKPEEFNLLAAKIVSLFPTESIYTYYMKAVPTCKSASGRYVPSKGKLVDKVRNLLYISGAKRRSTKSTYSNSNTDAESVSNNEEAGSNDDAIWLKHNNEPWDHVCEKWNNTFELRHKQKFLTVHEFLETWPILKNSKADALILLDFEKQYKEKSLNFYKNWEHFFSKLLKLRESIVTNEDAKAIIEGLGNITDDDKRIPVQVYLLGFLIPPKGRKSRKVKFSTTESIRGLLVQTDDAGDIDKVIKTKRTEAAARKDTVQPYVLIQGPLQNFSQIYIIIDDIKYHIQSAAKAFDLLFKIYHVFHAKYPQVAEHLHIIIQKKVYQVHTAYDTVPPYIVDVLNLDV